MHRKDRHKNDDEQPVNHKDDNISATESADPSNKDKKAGEELIESSDNENIDLSVKTADARPKESDLAAQYQELYEKYLRLAAEYDNFRKRTLKEKADLLKYGGEAVLTNLLPVIDDWERAMKTIESTQEIEAVKQGIMLICNKFSDFLVQNGIKEIEAFEKDFNVDIHEAITKIPSEELKGKVVEVLQKGYLLYDKVLRYSKVVVGE
jgi:molecular chaperone GrpE